MPLGNRPTSSGDSVVFRHGEVINIEDPYRTFRAQVRVFGMTDDKRGIPDEDLPWYIPLFPVTSPSFAGAGSSSGLEPGSKVVVMIMDYPSCNLGYIMGSHYPGPSSPSHVSPLAKGLEDKGPEVPIGPDGKKIDLGFFGNLSIIDTPQDLLNKFKMLWEKGQIFEKVLSLFKIGK